MASSLTPLSGARLMLVLSVHGGYFGGPVGALVLPGLTPECLCR